MNITVTLTIPELLSIPADGVTRILAKANPSREFLLACREWETRKDYGKGRWPILNHITKAIGSAPSDSAPVSPL
jgi:hypothetical protein